jgi:hypothetical protein
MIHCQAAVEKLVRSNLQQGHFEKEKMPKRGDWRWRAKCDLTRLAGPDSACLKAFDQCLARRSFRSSRALTSSGMAAYGLRMERRRDDPARTFPRNKNGPRDAGHFSYRIR